MVQAQKQIIPRYKWDMHANVPAYYSIAVDIYKACLQIAPEHDDDILF